jgi:DNA-binding protein YbaB
MSELRWDALLGGDPTQVERGIDEWVAAARQRADQLRELRSEVERIKVTHTSENGAVTVTVDSNGVPSDIRFTERASSVRPDDLGPLVMKCLRAAQSRIGGRVDDAAAATVGENLQDTRRMVVDSYRQRFGDAESEPAPARRPWPEHDFGHDDY